MKALVFEKTREWAMRDLWPDLRMGPRDVKVAIHTGGTFGIEIQYYKHGRIGQFVVEQPMVLGCAASGIVVEVGDEVVHLAPGDRVCMEPGIPVPDSPPAMRESYSHEPAVRFGPTPPVHGCLTPVVVHPASLCFPLSDKVSFAEGAMVGPLSIGLQAVTKARMRPGNLAVVIGAGTIGIMIALVALAEGASRVILADLAQEKLELLQGYPAIIPVNIGQAPLADTVAAVTAGCGADVVFEASGSARAFEGIFKLSRPNGCLVLAGRPTCMTAFDLFALQAREIRVESVFCYAQMFPRALALISGGQIDVKPFISRMFDFEAGVRTFESATVGKPPDVKMQICM